MKTRSLAITASLALLYVGFSGNVYSDQALATAKGCTACHQATAGPAPALGPTYSDVAAKYKGDASAESMLVEKVIKGGDGNWETTLPAMPPNNVTQEEAITLVKWVLSH